MRNPNGHTHYKNIDGRLFRVSKLPTYTRGNQTISDKVWRVERPKPPKVEKPKKVRVRTELPKAIRNAPPIEEAS